MGTATDLTTLKFNYLTQAQYEAALAQGLIEDDEFYLTPVQDKFTAGTGISIDSNDVISSYKLCIEVPSFSSLPVTVSDSRILSTHEVDKANFSNPSAVSSDITVTTVDGSVTLSGTVSGTTSCSLYLEVPLR